MLSASSYVGVLACIREVYLSVLTVVKVLLRYRLLLVISWAVDYGRSAFGSLRACGQFGLH
jgi:hypothetical protein